MCLWILTACMSMLPANPPPANIIVLPTPILQPTPAPTFPTFQTVPTFTTVPTVITVQTAPTVPIGPTNPVPGNMTLSPPLPTSITPIPTTTPAPAPTNPSSPATNTPAIGVDIVPLVFCDDPDSVCLVNPKSASGPPQIDPRLGTTSAPSAMLRSPLSTAVRFPREKRSADNGLSVKDYLSQLPEQRHHVISKRQACGCVQAGTCTTTSTNFGAGMIDIRIVTPGAQCPAGQVYCCTGTSGGATVACGVQQAVPATSVSPGAGQASFGEYPWQALILTTQNDYIAGGVLIDQLNVLTVTHRMVSYIVGNTAPNVKVRLGEWDAAGVYEPIPYQEFTIAKTFSHPSYNPNTLQFDLTVLRLSRAVPLTPTVGAAPTINRACLPPSASSVYTGQRCYVSGWGKNMFGVQGQYQQILKEVDVPIVAPATCQAQMQAARLGPTFMLDTASFVCAGGEANKDACTGDGGSGLVCQVNGQWVVVGLVAWGLGCANPNVPGAYVNIAGLLPWIQQQVATP